MNTNHSLIQWIINTFDSIIRFMYCRLSLHHLFNKKLYTSNIPALQEKFDILQTKFKKHHISLKNKVCLELGPGTTNINAYHFLANGAKKVYLVDKYPRQDQSPEQIELHRHELESIYAQYNITSLPTNEISFIGKGLTEVGIPAKSIDFCYSNSVFEHIQQVEENIETLSKLMKPGGIMYHDIDMRDHYNFNKPFLFYKYSNTMWFHWLSRPGVSFTNRVRHDDYVDLFTKYGFELIHTDIITYPLPRNIHDDLLSHNLKDLAIGKCQYLLRKTD